MEDDVAFAERLTNGDSWSKNKREHDEQINKGTSLTEQDDGLSLVSADSFCDLRVVIIRAD